MTIKVLTIIAITIFCWYMIARLETHIIESDEDYD